MKSIDLKDLSKNDFKKKLDSFFWEMMKKDIKCFELLIDINPELNKIVDDMVKEYGFEIDDISDDSIIIFNE
jgi:hypothetical protein